jgi:hypothetical protein
MPHMTGAATADLREHIVRVALDNVFTLSGHDRRGYVRRARERENWFNAKRQGTLPSPSTWLGTPFVGPTPK